MVFESILIAVLLGLAFLLEREQSKRSAAESLAQHYMTQIEDVINRNAEKGSPLRRWDRPTKHNKADEFYWLVRISGEDYLFTDEAINVAVKRADNMRERGLLTDE